MERQGLRITIAELQDLIINLSKQLTDLKCLQSNGYGSIKWQINIVNPEPKCSDTWRLEDSYLLEKTHPAPKESVE